MSTTVDFEHSGILSAAINDTITQAAWDKENNAYSWHTSPSSLTTHSTTTAFTVGNGASIYEDTLLPALESATQEVILTVCYWAPSKTLSALSAALRRLSAKVLIRANGKKVRVYICFSSRSLLQKLFHTSSPNGYVYPPQTWQSKLGLPAPEELQGLELTIKGLFFRPFSVLHSKYLIVDRRRVWLPSCNVSWEEWLECCIAFEGPIVQQVFDFWESVWWIKGTRKTISSSLEQQNGDSVLLQPSSVPNAPPSRFPSTLHPTTLLPHAHHSSWHLSFVLPYPLTLFFPSLHPSAPASPLNTALLHLLSRAKTSIILLTPNLTSLPLYCALLSALRRGISVRIITNKRMMVLEQILTAGGRSEWWINHLVRAHKRMVNDAEGAKQGHSKAQSRKRARNRLYSDSQVDLTMEAEEGRAPRQGASASPSRQKIGNLSVQYFLPQQDLQHIVPYRTERAKLRFDKTHVKLTIIDDEVAILGSGNMDRASWFTSQELGVMVEGKDIVGKIWEQTPLQEILAAR